MIQALQRLLDVLERDGAEDCVDAAMEVDRIAGPHIAFEETILYPRVATARGEEFVEKLRHEHRLVLEAIRFLLGRDKTQSLAKEDRTRLIEQVQTGIDHAATCGTLLSHITTLSHDQQTQMLCRLEDLRVLGLHWTDLNDVPLSSLTAGSGEPGIDAGESPT